MPERKDEKYDVTESSWKRAIKTVASAIWTGIKYIFKGLIWVAEKWWNYLDKIASTSPEDFQKQKKNEVEIITIENIKYYKTKDGSYKKLDV